LGQVDRIFVASRFSQRHGTGSLSGYFLGSSHYRSLKAEVGRARKERREKNQLIPWLAPPRYSLSGIQESPTALLPRLGLKPKANSQNQLKQVGEAKIDDRISETPVVQRFNPFQRV
jgi:hypothetical protein